MNETLYQNLAALRDQLRQQADEQGRFPKVCSDAALQELARLAPENKDELLLVNGLGKAFVEKFGDAFMTVLGNFHAERSAPMSVLTGDVKQILSNLENRLININRRNRLLYMPKLSATAIDLCGDKKFNDALLDFILHDKEQARLTICRQTESKEAEKLYTRLLRLQREIDRDARESGESSLYIAYPFVSGCTGVERFTIRAPLALFPVELAFDGHSVSLKIDAHKDIVLNTTLVLSHYKFNAINAELPDSEIDRGPDFFKRMCDFYEGVGIRLTDLQQGVVEPFTEYTADSFPRYRSGEFIVEEAAVLGRFTLCSSAIQRDFKNLIAGEKINPLVHDLLEDANDVDIYSDSAEIGEIPDTSLPHEIDLNYINDLNISQENAIRNINNHDRLVVQGPPGTGKSQAITCMIADFVNKGHNVLMVSQKKAALDVIYSRLGRQAKYALFVNDVKDKDDFYEQLYRIFSTTEEPKDVGTAFEQISSEIDADLKKLDALGDKLYYDTSAGAPMYRIYLENENNTFRRESGETIGIYSMYVGRELVTAGYDTLVEWKRMFSDAALLDTLKRFTDLHTKYPWLGDLRSSAYTSMQITSILGTVKSIIDTYAEVYSMPAIKRIFHKQRIRKPIKKLLKAHMEQVPSKLVKRLAAEPTDLYNGFEQYEQYYTLKAKYDELDTKQRAYFEAIYRLSKAIDCPLSELNRRVYDFCIYCILSEFEAADREVASTIGNFETLVREVSALIEKKKGVSRERFKAELIRAYKENIESSKRRGDMQRVIDGKRRMSIARFVSKFRFELFKGIRIWMMTPEVVSEVLPADNDLFDLVIFDEASQIYIERGVPGLARAKKAVIAGDHKQLRPSSLGDGRIGFDEEAYEPTDEVAAALEEESLLDLARFKYPEILLNYHYRSRYEELIAFSNAAFYKGRLMISPNVTQPNEPPISVVYTPNGRWEDRCNRAEAEAVIALLRDFFASGLDETIGIITFNVAQRDLICDLLDAECNRDSDFAARCDKEIMRTENGEDVGLFVKNIENVQGDERDRIIFSLAYAKNESGKVVRNFGWLNQEGGENRLNVAVSRAKKKIQIVTSIHAVDLQVDDLQNDGPRLFRKYLEYAEAVSAGDRVRAQTVLDCEHRDTHTYSVDDAFATEIFTALQAHGLRVEQNVGMGAYKIDIAVLDAQGNYRLGIECDANLYNRSSVARERDVQLRRYLTGRGWVLYRVWAPNWWHNQEEEIRHIKAAAGL